MKIIKCGGNSLKNYADRKKLYNEIKEYNGSIVLIVSAFHDSPYSTSSLKELLKDNYTYEMEQELITLGEVISSIRVTNELLNEFIDATLIYKDQIGIYVETTNKMDHIIEIDNYHIQEAVLNHKVVVIPGFVGINQNQRTVSLNRNGSDLTAMIVAKMLDMNDVFLYKDVLGLASFDPHHEKNYKLYKNVSYDLMLQIMLHGSDLIQEEAIRFAKDNQINVHVQHYLNHSYGTNVISTNKERVVVFQLNDNDVYIDGYNNKDTIENILILKDIPYDYILPCNSYIKIVSGYHNESQIIKLLHQMYMKGDL